MDKGKPRNSMERIFGHTWSIAWKIRSYRIKTIAGAIIFAAILGSLPFFFIAIQSRDGRMFNDWVLAWLKPRDFSYLVFFLIWSSCILLIIRILKDPMMLLNMLWAYNGVTLLRMASIWFISLNPPDGLLPLADPITNKFYGETYITHDLFFSGHTTTVFLVFLCLKKKADRVYALLASILLGFLLLVQHVHYTIDVIAAPVFTYLVYLLATRFTSSENQKLQPFLPN